MRRDFYSYYDENLVEYEVEYNYELGKWGTYFDPPEPHEVEIVQVVRVDDNELVKSNDLLERIEDEIYDELNNL